MEIRDKEFELFSQWANGREDFVPDGVVSEQDYIASQLKLCFILKEVNDKGGGGWDLREFIKEGSCGYTWNNITRWVICIINPAIKYTKSCCVGDTWMPEIRTDSLRA